MQALIDFIIRNLLALWPIAVVDEWHIAMMVRNGRIRRTLGTGLHWRWWFIEKKIEWPSSEVVLTLATASLTTADGRAVSVDANLGYRLRDIARSWRGVWNLETSIRGTASGVMCSLLATKRWAEFQGVSRVDREREIRETLNAALTSYGVEIVRLHLVACVEARQHRHFIDGSLAR
jgi:regulator of protease activity HflC (stomatin/prohibitin superfamily)